MTMRWSLPVSFHAVSTSASGTGRASMRNAPLVIASARRGQLGQDVAGRHRSLSAADDLQARRAQRGGRDRGDRSGDRADLDPGERPGAIGAVGDDGSHRGGGRLAPQVVDHHVDLGGGLAEPAGAVAESASSRTVPSAPSAGSAASCSGVAARGDDPARAELLGDLHGHLPGVAGGAQNQHVLAGLEPIRRRSATHDDIAGFMAAATSTGSLPPGSTKLRRRSMTVCSAIAPMRGVTQDEVAQRAVGRAAHPVDAGDQRQVAGAGVVRAVGLRPHPAMQARSDDVDEDLVSSVAASARGIPGRPAACRTR